MSMKSTTSTNIAIEAQASRPPDSARFRRFRAIPAISLISVLLLWAASSSHAQTRWVGTWAAAQQLPEPRNALAADDLRDATLRQIVRLSIGGAELRVYISNRFGHAPLRFSSVHIAKPVSAASAKIVPGSDKALTFSGNLDVTVPAGADYVSDPISFPMAALSDLAITLHIDDPPSEQTGHPGSRATSYLVHGDQVSAADLPDAKKVEHWYFIAGIDVDIAVAVPASPPAAAIVTLGDSITDGHGATTDANNRWPDVLANRLQASAATRSLAVLNQGIGGNRLLLDGLGPNALARFDHDVLAQAGVRYLIVLEGVNDLGTLVRDAEVPQAEHEALVHRVIAAYEQIITRARALGIQVIGATILPYTGSTYYHPGPSSEADRQTINQWIRTPGHFDAVVDFDKITRDPEHPNQLLPAFDSGDHLHPSPAGYAAMAGAVPLSLFASAAQDRAQNLPSGQMTAEQDHRRIMDLLRIDVLRPGADGSHPDAPNAANYDESKANPFPGLPDPLLLKNGRRVTTPKTWWSKRRPEIVEDFDREIYGRVPKTTPKVSWEVTSTTTETIGDVPVVTKKLVGHVDNSSYPAVTVDIQLTLTTPAHAAGPVPIVMEIAFSPEFLAALARRAGAQAPSPANLSGPSWQQQLLARGWGYAELVATSVQADNGAGLAQGIIGLCNKGQPRKLDDWGALRAWAWGASRALDYFETDKSKSVDARQVGLVGHSRYGKAALVAMAYDPRFAIVFVSSSGEGGAKLHRRNWGEIVENLAATGEYHWMAGNFLKYAGPLHWNDLPVDSHELIALCAPRPVFISAGATRGDGWVDAKGMFLAAAGAGPVYELLGKKGIGATDFPGIETPLIDGDVAFRQHSGGHTLGPNWPTFLKFADRYVTVPASK
jgi:lysophospholipase L1-like esterase